MQKSGRSCVHRYYRTYKGGRHIPNLQRRKICHLRRKMYSKCYPIITDFSEVYDKSQAPFDEKWHTFCNLGRRSYLMVQNISGNVKFSPLFIHSFPLLAPNRLSDSEKFNIRFSQPSEMTDIADKLRFHRYKKALLQSDVAAYIGVDRATYSHYEEIGRDYYPIEHIKKLAELYGVPVTEH